MKKDHIYRGLSVLGAIANGAAFCFPSLALELKGTSALTRVGLGLMASRHGASLTAGRNFFLATADILFGILNPHSYREEVDPALYFAETLLSGGELVKQAIVGIDHEAKLKEKTRLENDENYKIENWHIEQQKRAKREKGFRYRYPQSRIADGVFRGVNGVGLAADVVAEVLPTDIPVGGQVVPVRGIAKAVSTGCLGVSVTMIALRNYCIDHMRANKDEIFPKRKSLQIGLMAATGFTAILDMDASAHAFDHQRHGPLATHSVNLMSMSLQLGNLQNGLYPEITSLHAIKARKHAQERQRKIDQFRP